MIGWMVIGLLGCGWGDLKEEHAVDLDDLVWPDAEDRRLFVELAAYYDRAFPTWTTGPLWYDTNFRVNRTWCSPEIPAERCAGYHLFKVSWPEKVLPSPDDPGADVLSPGSWIWLSARVPDRHAREVGQVGVIFFQKPTDLQPFVSGEAWMDHAKGENSLHFGWSRDKTSMSLGFSLPIRAGEGASPSSFDASLRRALTSSDEMKAICLEASHPPDTEWVERYAREHALKPEEKVALEAKVLARDQKGRETLERDAAAMWGDLNRAFPPSVFLAP